MSLRRLNPKRDANELAIVQSLRKLGCRVLRLSGKGVPDLAVLWPPKGGWTLAEVKGARGRLTEAQAAFATDPHVRIWRSLDDALADLGMVRR